MKKSTLTASVTSIALTGAGLTLLAPSASARVIDIGDGKASVLLTQCNDAGKPQSKTFIEGCSNTSFKGKLDGGKITYTFLTSDGDTTWSDGSATGGSLAFPAGGQAWKPITGLPLETTSTSTPSDITGTLNLDTGEVTLKVKVNTQLFSKTQNNSCVLTGEATLTSVGTDGLGGVAKGSNFDAATGRFAVVSTSPVKVTTAGSGCGGLTTLYKVDEGMGYYLSGKIGFGDKPPTPDPLPIPTPEADQDQTASVKVAKTIKPKGKTVVLKKAVTTNAGQRATAKVTWGTKKAKGTSKKWAAVKTTEAGKVTITTTGAAKRLRVKLHLSAPATTGYKAYSHVHKWVVK